MNKSETAKTLLMIKMAFPKYYLSADENEINLQIDIWHELFKDDSYKLIEQAVKALMCTLKFPPTIADVKEKIALITQFPCMSEMEAWNKVKSAMSSYHSQECFDGLTPILQRIVGSPNQLREWAIMDLDTVNSVVQSNFMRSYKALAAKEKEYTALPTSAKVLMDNLGANKIGVITEQPKKMWKLEDNEFEIEAVEDVDEKSNHIRELLAKAVKNRAKEPKQLTKTPVEELEKFYL